MPRHFEGNLAKKGANDAGNQSERSSGFLGKDEWKKLEELDPNELEDVSLNPLDVSEYASRKEEADEALQELAMSDLLNKRKKRGRGSAEPRTEKQKAIDEEMEALSLRDKLDAEKETQRNITATHKASERSRLLKTAPDLTKDSVMELEDEDLEDYDEDAERQLAEEKQLKLQRKKTLKRIAVREANIERLKGETADWEAEKDAIETQSAKRLKAIEIANRANAAANAMAFEERAKPMREVARQFGREQAASERSREDQRINEQLEMTEDGKVLGLKNIPLADWDAVRRGMAARMEAIRGEMLRLLEEPSSSRRNTRLKTLELESAKWMEMYRDGKIIEESGTGPKDNHLKNRFYRQIDIAVPEGVSRVDAETIAVSPDSELNHEIEFLRNQDQKLDALIQKAGAVLWGLADRLDQAERDKGTAELLEGINQYAHAENAEDAREIKYLELLDQPQYLDLRGRKLQHDAVLMSRQAAELRKNFKSFKDRDMREQFTNRIEELESGSVEMTRDFEVWQGNSIRAEAMEMRHEDLQDKIHWLRARQEMRTKNELHVAREEGAQRLRSRADGEEQLVKELVQPAKDRLLGLVREKAEKAQRLEALLLEKFNREQGVDGEIEPLAFDIDVDTSDFEEEGISKKAA